MTRQQNRGGTGSGEYGRWMAVTTSLCALSVVSAVVPVVERLVGAALIAVLVVAAPVAVLRRELRIRRQLAAITPPPAREFAGRSGSPRPSSPPAASAATRTGGAP